MANMTIFSAFQLREIKCRIILFSQVIWSILCNNIVEQQVGYYEYYQFHQ